jgi:ferredoxin
VADSKHKSVGNVPGPWFVDEECIACGRCVGEADDFFQLGVDFSHVIKQPQTAEEEIMMENAREACPVQAIGKEA